MGDVLKGIAKRSLAVGVYCKGHEQKWRLLGIRKSFMFAMRDWSR